MAMFEAASKSVAKSVGSKTLHHVPDLNSAERFKTLCVVRKVSSFWFWKKPKYYPTQIKIEDLLNQKLKLDIADEKYTLLQKFTENPKFTIKGDVGGEISKEFHLDLSGDDVVTMTINLGDLQKRQVKWQKLYEALLANSVNKTHALIASVKKQKRTSLCVVIESVSTVASGAISKTDDKSAATDDSVNASTKVMVDIHTKDSVEVKDTHSFTIPSDTVLAYNCNEISLKNDTSFTLHPSIDTMDDWGQPFLIKDMNIDDSAESIQNEFGLFMKSNEFKELQNLCKGILGTVSDAALDGINLILSAGELYLEDNENPKSTSISTIKNSLGDDFEMFKPILHLVGFIFPEDTTNPDAEVMFPGKDGDSLIKSCIGLFDAMSDVKGEARKLLSSISQENIKTLYKMVEQELRDSDNISTKNSDVRSMFEKDPSTKTFLHSAGFVSMSAGSNEEILVFPKENSGTLLDLFTVLYIFSDS